MDIAGHVTMLEAESTPKLTMNQAEVSGKCLTEEDEIALENALHEKRNAGYVQRIFNDDGFNLTTSRDDNPFPGGKQLAYVGLTQGE